jgi:hypothetical protein
VQVGVHAAIVDPSQRRRRGGTPSAPQPSFPFLDTRPFVPASTLLARCLAVVAVLATSACSIYLDARAEAALREALVRVVGPAESYDVRVSGASVDGSRFERVRFVGRRIARADSPVLDRLELDLRGVVVDRAGKSLTAVAASRVELQLKGADLAVFLGRWLGEPVVTLTAPDRIAIVGTPRIGAIALGGGAELQGRLAGAGSQLLLTIDRIRLGRGEAPPLARVLVESAINPIFDVADRPLPARLDAVEVGSDDTIRIAASGSRLPPPP